MGAVLAAGATSVRIQGEDPNQADNLSDLIRDQHDQTRGQGNETSTRDSEQTRALINQSYANNTQEHQATREQVNETHDWLLMQHEQTRDALNGTIPWVTQQHEQTRALINQTAPGGGGCNASCQANITNSVVENITIADPTGDVFVLGHLQDPADQESLRFAVYIAILLVLAFAAIRGGTLFPFLSLFGALMLSLFIITHNAAIIADNQPVITAMAILPFVVMVYAGFNLIKGLGRRHQTP